MLRPFEITIVDPEAKTFCEALISEDARHDELHKLLNEAIVKFNNIENADYRNNIMNLCVMVSQFCNDPNELLWASVKLGAYLHRSRLFGPH